MNNSKRSAGFNAAGLLLGSSFLLTGVGCIPEAQIISIEGTSAQATEVRTALIEGQLLFAQVRGEIDNILMTLGASEVARMLMFEPAAGGLSKINKTDIGKLVGEYEEVAPGIFSFLPDVGGTIDESLRINYSNGVDLKLHNFKYSQSGQLIEINVFATSNNRNIVTPLDAPIAINGKVLRSNVPDILSWLEPSTIALDGNASYHRDGQVITVSIERAAGGITNNILPTSVLKTKTSYFKVWDVTKTVGLRDSAPFWHEETEITYAPTQLVLIWNMLNSKQTYKDSNGIHYEVNINYNSGIPVASNHYAYTASSDIRYNKPNDNNPEWYRVAKIKGGPFVCAYTTAASGVNIIVNWYDLIEDIVMPTAEMNCSVAVKVANNI